MPGTLIKFTFAILQNCQQRIVLILFLKKECERIFFLSEFCAWIHAWYFVSLLHRVNYSLLTALQNCKCEFNQGSQHSSIFEFVWQKFPHHAFDFFVFDSIDKYRIDIVRIIFKILKKNICYFEFFHSGFPRSQEKLNK